MRTLHKFMLAAATGALAVTTACTTDPYTGQKRINRTAVGILGGAVGGYLLGDVVGGRNDRTERLIGAGIGAIAGGGKGAAIGAIIGGSAGAGSVIVQGKEDLELKQGSSITVQASSPLR